MRNQTAKVAISIMAIVAITSSTALAQNALNFDGVNDNVMTTAPAITGSAARTVEAWIRTTAPGYSGSTGNQRVILDMGTMVNSSRFTFNMLWNHGIRLEVGGNGLSGTTPINNGQWRHVAATYDPLLTTNQVKLYVDGVLDIQGNLTVPVSTAAGNIIMGVRLDGVNFWSGDIDEVRVWNTVRTQAELQQFKDAEFCTPQPGLVAYFKCNQGNAGNPNPGLTTLINTVGTGNGTLNNFALTGTGSNWISGAPLTKAVTQGPTLTVTNCGPYLSPGGKTYSVSGIYNDTLNTTFGCDSIVLLNLTIKENSTTAFAATGCPTYISPSGKIWSMTGLYHDTIPNAAGCDSVIKVSLTTVTIDTSVTQTGSVSLMANATSPSATFLWIDCNTGFPVPGGNVQSLTASANGSYAVIVSYDGCSDTSGCWSIVAVGIDELKADRPFEVFPNPTCGKIYFSMNTMGGDMMVEVTNAEGRSLILNHQIPSGDPSMELGGLASGIYYLVVRDASGIIGRKKILRM